MPTISSRHGPPMDATRWLIRKPRKPLATTRRPKRLFVLSVLQPEGGFYLLPAFLRKHATPCWRAGWRHAVRSCRRLPCISRVWMHVAFIDAAETNRTLACGRPRSATAHRQLSAHVLSPNRSAPPGKRMGRKPSHRRGPDHAAGAARSFDLRPTPDSGSEGLRLHVGSLCARSQTDSRLLSPAPAGGNRSGQARRPSGRSPEEKTPGRLPFGLSRPYLGRGHRFSSSFSRAYVNARPSVPSR